MSTAVQVQPGRRHCSQRPAHRSASRLLRHVVRHRDRTHALCLHVRRLLLSGHQQRPVGSTRLPPNLLFPFILLVILLSSSVVLEVGRKPGKARKRLAAGEDGSLDHRADGARLRIAAMLSSTSQHWKDLTPYSDSYGSIFYAITTLHAAHVIAGLLMLGFVGILPRYGATAGSPHRAYETVALYWHFVDFVWIFIVLLLYVIPHFQAASYGH